MITHVKEVATEAPILAIAKIGICESLSGLCELEYHIGYEVDAKERICVRIWSSSGNGIWNRDWKYLSDIDQVLSQSPDLFRVSALKPVYSGQSSNSHSFLAAILKAENLIGLAGTVEGEYTRCNGDVWWKALQALVEAETALPDPAMEQGESPIATPAPKVGKKSAKKSAALAA
jgi:hypothetical protein